MVKSRRVFTREFKLAAVKELESGKPLGGAIKSESSSSRL
jgi:transposase-like protein